jgi:O-antigen/teichoic acid export membrane protein
VAAVLLHGTLVTLTTLYCAGILLGALLLNVWLWFWHRPGIRPGLRWVELSVSRELFGEGILFFVLQLSGLIVFNSDNLVITHYLGASEVTPYSVAWRLTGYASTFQAVLLPSAWPAFSEAYHRGDLKWVRETYHRMTRGSVLAVGAAALGIALIGRPLIRVWAGQAAVPGTLLLWCMSCWVVVLAYTVNQAMLLAATRRIQLQSACSAVAALANLGLSIVLVQRMGALGVLLATILSYLLFVVAPQIWEVRKVLSGRYVQGDAC